MICKNCGGQMGDFDTFCPNCGASNAINTANTQYSQNSYAQTSTEPIKTTGLLVWSIIEIVCCICPITGIIAIILWATLLKPAANRGDAVEAKKAKKPIKIVLWIGLILWAVVMIINILIAYPMIKDGIENNERGEFVLGYDTYGGSDYGFSYID